MTDVEEVLAAAALEEQADAVNGVGATFAGLQPGQAALAAYLRSIEGSRDDEFILVRVAGAFFCTPACLFWFPGYA